MSGSSIQISGSCPAGDPEKQTVHPNGVIDVDASKATQRATKSVSAFIKSAARPPWPATHHILDYISHAATIMIRGERKHDSHDSWNAFFRLSGCAGMAQTSSFVAEHWIRKWIEDSPDEIRNILADFNFEIDEIPTCHEEFLYAPTKELGYASFWPDADKSASGDEPWTAHFDIDASAYDHLDDGGLALEKQLQNTFGKVMADGVCRCQLCSPEFDPTNYAI